MNKNSISIIVAAVLALCITSITFKVTVTDDTATTIEKIEAAGEVAEDVFDVLDALEVIDG